MRKITIINILFTILVFVSAGISYVVQNGEYNETTKRKKVSIVPSAILTDSRDGNKYKVIQVRNQVWMAENLRYISKESYCYKNSEVYCKKYGRLYANIQLDVCPDLFRVPTKEDWDTLFHAFKEPKKAGRFLKSEEGWRFSKNGEDIINFNVIPVPEDTIEPNRIRGTKSCFWGNMDGRAILRCFDLSDTVEYWPQWGSFNHARQIEKLHPIRCIFTPPPEEEKKSEKTKKKKRNKGK